MTMGRRTTQVAVAAVAALMTGGVVRGEAQELEEARTLTLDQAVEIALERNLALERAREELTAAGQVVREAWGSVMPSVDLSTTYTRNLEVPATFIPAVIFDPEAEEGEFIAARFGADHQWLGMVTVEQPVLEAAAFVGVGAASRYRAYTREVLRGEAQQMVSRVRDRYLAALLAEEAARLRGGSAARVERTLADTRAMWEAGLASEYDVLRLEVELANLATAARRAENEARAARRQLAAELGLSGVDAVVPAGSLSALSLARPEENGPAEAALLRHVGVGLADPPEARPIAEDIGTRTDVRQAGLNVERAEIELRLERAEYLPRVGLFGTYQVNAQNDGGFAFFGGSDGMRADATQVGFRVTVPVFSGFQRGARVQQREAALRSARAALREVEIRAEADLRSAHDAVSHSREAVDAQRRAVAQAERGYEIARVQYREGVGSRIEVTDAENALRQSEFNHAQALHDYLVARARLEEAHGRTPGVDRSRMEFQGSTP